ncbi:MAG: PIN domain-containing protein [Chloroflexi bacterium]|nr:MAG: PIN domain-containing protein [Chloroflexota bacterium]
MNQILVDTGAWDAIVDSGDSNHELALLFQGEISGRYKIVVTNYILDELYTLLLMNVGYRGTVQFKRQLDVLVEERILEVIWVTPEIAAEAWSVFEKFNRDKDWSYTDCVSYAVMKQLDIAEAFAFDHHFEQMGFVRRP